MLFVSVKKMTAVVATKTSNKRWKATRDGLLTNRDYLVLTPNISPLRHVPAMQLISLTP